MHHPLNLTASGYEQKALVAQPAVMSPGTLARSASRRSPGGQATMAQFLPVPANDKVVPVQDLSRAGFTKLVNE